MNPPIEDNAAENQPQLPDYSPKPLLVPSTLGQAERIQVVLDLDREPQPVFRPGLGPWVDPYDTKKPQYMKNVDAYVRLLDGSKSIPIRLCISPGWGVLVSKDLLESANTLPQDLNPINLHKIRASRGSLDSEKPREPEYKPTIAYQPVANSRDNKRLCIDVAIPVEGKSSLFGMRIKGVVRPMDTLQASNGPIDMWIGLHSWKAAKPHQWYFRNVVMQSPYVASAISLATNRGPPGVEYNIKLNHDEHPDLAAQRGAQVPKTCDELSVEAQAWRNDYEYVVIQSRVDQAKSTQKERIRRSMVSAFAASVIPDVDLSALPHVLTYEVGPSRGFFPEHNVNGFLRLWSGDQGRQIRVGIGPGSSVLIMSNSLEQTESSNQQYSMLRYDKPNQLTYQDPQSARRKSPWKPKSRITIDILLPLQDGEDGTRLLSVRVHAMEVEGPRILALNGVLDMFIGTDQLTGSSLSWSTREEGGFTRYAMHPDGPDGRKFHIRHRFDEQAGPFRSQQQALTGTPSQLSNLAHAQQRSQEWDDSRWNEFAEIAAEQPRLGQEQAGGLQAQQQGLIVTPSEPGRHAQTQRQSQARGAHQSGNLGQTSSRPPELPEAPFLDDRPTFNPSNPSGRRQPKEWIKYSDGLYRPPPDWVRGRGDIYRPPGEESSSSEDSDLYGGADDSDTDGKGKQPAAQRKSQTSAGGLEPMGSRARRWKDRDSRSPASQGSHSGRGELPSKRMKEAKASSNSGSDRSGSGEYQRQPVGAEAHGTSRITSATGANIPSRRDMPNSPSSSAATGAGGGTRTGATGAEGRSLLGVGETQEMVDRTRAGSAGPLPAIAPAGPIRTTSLGQQVDSLDDESTYASSRLPRQSTGGSNIPDPRRQGSGDSQWSTPLRRETGSNPQSLSKRGTGGSTGSTTPKPSSAQKSSGSKKSLDDKEKKPKKK